MEKIIIFLTPLAIFVFGMFIFNWLWGICWPSPRRHYSQKVVSDISKYNEFAKRQELLSNTMRQILNAIEGGSYNTTTISDLVNALNTECVDIRSLCNSLENYFKVPSFPENSLRNLVFNYYTLDTANKQNQNPFYKIKLGDARADLYNFYNALNELYTVEYKEPKFVWWTHKPYILHQNGIREYA